MRDMWEKRTTEVYEFFVSYIVDLLGLFFLCVSDNGSDKDVVGLTHAVDVVNVINRVVATRERNRIILILILLFFFYRIGFPIGVSPFPIRYKDWLIVLLIMQFEYEFLEVPQSLDFENKSQW